MTEGATGNIKVSENSGCGMLYVSGSFAFHLQSEFRIAYESLTKNNKLIQLDLQHADYMDSSGLGMLLVMKKYLDRFKVSCEIVRSKGQPLDLLTMTHFDQYFKINGATTSQVLAQ